MKLPPELDPERVAKEVLDKYRDVPGWNGFGEPADFTVAASRSGMLAALKAVKRDIEERFYGGAEVEQTAFVTHCIAELEGEG